MLICPIIKWPEEKKRNCMKEVQVIFLWEKIQFWIIILTELEIKHAMFVSEAPEVETIIFHDYIKGMPL